MILKNSENIIDKLTKYLEKKFSLHAMVGVEIEFYIVNKGSPHANFLKQVEKEGLSITKEKGDGQYEIFLEHTKDLKTLCKKIQKTKLLLIETAKGHLLNLNFEPKPFPKDFGSAAHYHISLYTKDGFNAFKDEKILNNSITGILELINPSLYMFTENNEQEFNRFVPKFMTPTHIAWGGNNRTTIIRIPESNLQNKRIELRLLSASSSAEYAIIFLLTSIIYGLEKKQNPPPRIYGNAYDPQYDLTPLLQNNDEAKKCFYFDKIIANYI